MPGDDAAAVAEARGGNEDAFRVLVERHGRAVFRLAFRMTGRAEDAEDVVQETFIRVHRQLGRFEARSNFGTWVYRIAFNCAIDYMRARPHRESAESHDRLEQLSGQNLAASADDLVFAAEIGERMQQALGCLSAQERAAFLLRHFHGSSIEEICQTLGLRANAAKHSIFRAVRKMRIALRPVVTGSGVQGSGVVK
jgi:RNA polymerase sigma-70 factor (ECF subfamily)